MTFIGFQWGGSSLTYCFAIAGTVRVNGFPEHLPSPFSSSGLRPLSLCRKARTSGSSSRSTGVERRSVLDLVMSRPYAHFGRLKCCNISRIRRLFSVFQEHNFQQYLCHLTKHESLLGVERGSHTDVAGTCRKTTAPLQKPMSPLCLFECLVL